MGHWMEVQKPTWVWHLRSWDDIVNASKFTLANYMNIILLVVFLLVALRQVRATRKVAEKDAFQKRYIQAPEFPPIEELKDFDWKATEPAKMRPFKPKYHLTMALETLEPSELLLMDRNYADRIALRRRTMAEQGTHVLNVNDDYRIRPAIVELYSFLLGTYLPKRFPAMFKLHETSYEHGKSFMLENLVTKAIFPAQPLPQTPTKALLETLGRTLDEDFFFLLPEEEDGEPAEKTANEKDTNAVTKYVCEAYLCCCPSGFDPLEKIGKRLASIHGPVPGYASKLESSMDRFFARVEVGKYVRRMNWAITTHGNLFSAAKGSNHAHEGDVVEEMDEIDVDNTFLRCERQTLHRLPKSKALVFGFKTYLYPLSQIKEEGQGEELAQAIDGLKEGSVPAMNFYKKGPVWGEAVKRYLRS